MTTQTKWIIGILILLALVAGFFVYQRPVSDGEVIKIGGAFGLTGFAATWGEADRNGAQLAIEELQAEGVPVEIVFQDTQSDNTKALSAVRKLINIDGVDALLGPTWLDTFGSAAPLSDSEDIIIITPSAVITAVEAEQNFQNIFSTWYRSDTQLQRFPKYLAGQEVNTVAFIITNEGYWSDLLTNFKIGAENYDISVIDVIKVDPTSTDFRTSISKLRELNPDVVFSGFSTEENLLSFSRQQKELYPEAQLVTVEYIEEFIPNPDYAGLLEGIQFTSPEIRQTNFDENYKKRFGVDPVFSASNSYDATNILVEALLNTDRSTKATRNYILSNAFDTVTFGRIRFDEIGGVVGGTFVVKEITKNGVVVIEEL